MVAVSRNGFAGLFAGLNQGRAGYEWRQYRVKPYSRTCSRQYLLSSLALRLMWCQRTSSLGFSHHTYCELHLRRPLRGSHERPGAIEG